ncbi:hypothetical protein IJG29_00030 [Candidatus Saccharibacteria bacterium]|nr:hypothetical protein [Candidatus Saccharibacteria bacterium]
MSNNAFVNYFRENKSLSIVLLVEIILLVGLAIALPLTANNPKPQTATLTIGERESCGKTYDTAIYKEFNDRIYYYPSLNEGDDDYTTYLSMVFEELEKNYPDPNVRIIIDDIQDSIDEKVIRGYQIIDGIVIEDTFFAVFANENGLVEEFPTSFINPESIDVDGLLKNEEVENTIYPKMVDLVKDLDEKEVRSCFYTLYYTDDRNGVIDRPPSGFYYLYRFIYKKEGGSASSNYPQGIIYIDGKTGETLDGPYIDNGIRILNAAHKE